MPNRALLQLSLKSLHTKLYILGTDVSSIDSFEDFVSTAFILQVSFMMHDVRLNPIVGDIIFSTFNCIPLSQLMLS